MRDPFKLELFRIFVVNMLTTAIVFKSGDGPFFFFFYLYTVMSLAAGVQLIIWTLRRAAAYLQIFLWITNFAITNFVFCQQPMGWQTYLIVCGSICMATSLAIEITYMLVASLESETAAKTQLIHSNKMTALGEMAGGIAHEVNTPLGTIGLLAGRIHDLASKEDGNYKAMADSSRIIKEAVRRIGSIVHGLRSFSRDGAADPVVETSVTGIIDSTLALCNERFKQNCVEVRRHGAVELYIACRPTQISQVLLNLLGNAFDAIAQLPEKWIEIESRDLGEKIEIRVTDCGHGVPKDLREKIMQPFFTTKEFGKGTGLGLSISKRLMESHSGSLDIDTSAANTCFVMQLPKANSKMNRAPAA